MAWRFSWLGSLFLLLLVLLRVDDGDATVAVIGEHLIDDGLDLLFQFVDKQSWIVRPVLYITQFFLPDTCELRTLQQFFPDKLYQFDTRRRSNKVFPFLTYIMATEQRLDDGSAGGRATYAVFPSWRHAVRHCPRTCLPSP